MTIAVDWDVKHQFKQILRHIDKFINVQTFAFIMARKVCYRTLTWYSIIQLFNYFGFTLTIYNAFYHCVIIFFKAESDCYIIEIKTKYICTIFVFAYDRDLAS